MAGIGSATSKDPTKIGQTGPTSAAPQQDPRTDLVDVRKHALKLKEYQDTAKNNPNDKNAQGLADAERKSLEDAVFKLATDVQNIAVNASADPKKAKAMVQSFKDMEAGVVDSLKAIGAALPASIIGQVRSVESVLNSSGVAPAVVGPSSKAATPKWNTSADPVALQKDRDAKLTAAQQQMAARQDPALEQVNQAYTQMERDLRADKTPRQAVLDHYGKTAASVLNDVNVSKATMKEIEKLQVAVSKGEMTLQEAEVQIKEIVARAAAQLSDRGIDAAIGPSKVGKFLDKSGTAPSIDEVEDPKQREMLKTQEKALEQQRLVALLTALMQQRHEALMAIIRAMGGGRS